MNDSAPPNPKRRWCQFSLRTLMLLVLAGGMVFGWIGIRMRRAHTNRESVAEVRKTLAEIQAMDGASPFVSKRGITLLSEKRRSATWLDPHFPFDPVRFGMQFAPSP
jgi:hypothetical protein